MEIDRHPRPATQSTSSSASAPQAPVHHSRPQSPHSHYSGQPGTDNGAVPRDAPGSIPTPQEADVTPPSDPLADLKRPRACEACRQLKVRCDPDPGHPDGSCKRCAKAMRRCVVTVPTRKRQKKADNRVAELERKIDALTASLHASRAQVSAGDLLASPLPQTPEQEVRSENWSGQFPSRENSSARRNGASQSSPRAFAGAKRHYSGELKRTFVNPIITPLSARQHSPSEDGPTAPTGRLGRRGDEEWPQLCSSLEGITQTKSENEYRDVIDRGIIDVETATKAFERYVNNMAPSAPFIVFPPGTPMSDVRRTKPVLFLSILSVSIGPFRPQLQVPFQNETHRIFADRVLVRGEKSLELIQALLVATIWYLPPDHFEELKFYQFVHTAAVMGVDIGMNRKTKANSKTLVMWKEVFGNKAPMVDPKSLEARRAWLGCYTMAVNASMSLRRPLFIRWQSYNAESIEMLESDPDALPSDQTIIQWVKLAHIGEDICFHFSMDDPTISVNITDPKIQYALKGFERQLEDWRREVPSDIYTPVMEHYENVLNVYMHEIGMHVDHNIDDFKPPFIGAIGEERQVDLGTAAHVDALTLIHHLRACADTDGGRLGAKFALMMAMLKSWHRRSKDKRQPLIVPSFFKAKDSGDADCDSVKEISVHGKPSTAAAPTPLDVLSEVATGGPQDAASELERSSKIQAVPIPQPNQAITVHPSAGAAPVDQIPTTTQVAHDASTTAPPGALITPFINQQMGLSHIPPSQPPMTTEYQPAFSQHQAFGQVPDAMDGVVQQQDLWTQGFMPDADLNLALAFQGNVWDDDFFPFPFDFSDKSF
ncbi:predicted protein [Uncinocarpus reesii 1704]|uniref:Zn(2)-C6 fungal-type domain-containing protein n=1 Tax=Uncinocarpus reesii (strain UAMH 1704) TaxID=336963 RepID=C4JJ73_UNCRE|nr:uncharacterized protein UREG_01680 [Uncinocarpus reesii 1704]EEP76831.1 predicted protein [Uncinocarpus reesii 1704]